MGILYLLVTYFLFAVLPIGIKILLKDNYIDAYTLAFFRFFFGTLSLLAIQYYRKNRISMYLNSWWVLIGGIGLGLDFILFNIGLKYTTATATSLLANATHMIAMGMFGWLFLKENFGFIRIIGFTATLVGMVFVTLGGQDLRSVFVSEYFMGNMIIVFAGVIWTLYGVAQKMVCKKARTIEIIIPVFIVGTVLTGLSAVPKFGNLKPMNPAQLVAVIIVCIVCTGLSYAFFAKALQTVDMVVAGVIGSLTPVFTVVMAFFFLNETLTASIVIGMIMVLSGTLLLVSQEKPSAC